MTAKESELGFIQINQGTDEKHTGVPMMLYFWNRNKRGVIKCLYILIKIQNSADADGGPRSQVGARLTFHSAPHQHKPNIA